MRQKCVTDGKLDKIPPKAVDKTAGWKCKRGHTFVSNYEAVRNKYWCYECMLLERREAKEKCKYVNKQGKNKGKQCTAGVKVDGYCWAHKNYIDQQEKKKKGRMRILRRLRELRRRNSAK